MTEHQSSVDWSSIADLIADRVVQRFVATASADRWLKVEEAAELLGVTEKTIETRVYRARQRLREKLDFV